ncbi:hypothetical protein OAL35_01710 [bacterium]|nr:hypothetical protein [bacterium]
MTTNQCQTNGIPVDSSRKRMERGRQSAAVHNYGVTEQGNTGLRSLQFGLVEPRLWRDLLLRHAGEVRYLFTVIA